MNVLIVVPWDQEFGGVASVVGNLATYLEKGNGVFFLHPGEENTLSKGITKWGFEGYKLRMRVPLVKGHTVRSLIAFLLFFPVTLIQIVYLLVSHRVDIINVHYPSAEFFYFAICRRLFRIKLVTSIHGADIFPAGMPRVHYPMGIKILVSSSDRIVAPSRAFLHEFMNLFPIQESKGCFIHNGISIDEMKRPETHNRVGENKYLLCIAAHNEKKAIDVLIYAFSRVAANHSSIQLLLVGDGPLRHQNEELVRSLGVGNRITFLGDRGRSDVVSLLHGCELFVLPSRSEPFGIVITEAMACRKPVVATMVGGIPEIIENGKSGILVEPDDPDALSTAICSILEDDTLKAQLAANGYARVCANFLRQHTGAKYETLFSSLLNSPNLNS